MARLTLLAVLAIVDGKRAGFSEALASQAGDLGTVFRADVAADQDLGLSMVFPQIVCG